MNGAAADRPGTGPLDVARQEMRPHERLIWADRPRGRARSSPALGRIVFGLIFGGFAVFWTSAAWLMTRGVSNDVFGLFFPLFGIPFIVVGAGMVVAGFKNWRDGGATVYALSEERVLIISGAPKRTVRSLDLTAIRGVERVEGEGGAGTITLLVAGATTMREVLAGVPDVARVGAEIERLRTLASEEQAPPTAI